MSDLIGMSETLHDKKFSFDSNQIFLIDFDPLITNLVSDFLTIFNYSLMNLPKWPKMRVFDSWKYVFRDQVLLFF
jgi:hypothetical protein